MVIIRTGCEGRCLPDPEIGDDLSVALPCPLRDESDQVGEDRDRLRISGECQFPQADRIEEIADQKGEIAVAEVEDPGRAVMTEEPLPDGLDRQADRVVSSERLHEDGQRGVGVPVERNHERAAQIGDTPGQLGDDAFFDVSHGGVWPG